MGAMPSQITSLTIVYSTVYSGADQRKHQSLASLAFVRGIHRWGVNSSHKWIVTRKMFPFDDVIIWRSRAMNSGASYVVFFLAFVREKWLRDIWSTLDCLRMAVCLSLLNEFGHQSPYPNHYLLCHIWTNGRGHGREWGIWHKRHVWSLNFNVLIVKSRRCRTTSIAISII